MCIFDAMTGKEIYERESSVYSRYARLLQTIRLNIGEEDLYDLLEQAESMGKELAFKETAEDIHIVIQDEYTKEDITFVDRANK